MTNFTNNTPDFIEKGEKKEYLKKNYDFRDLMVAVGGWIRGGGNWIYFGENDAPGTKHRAFTREHPGLYQSFNTGDKGDIIEYIRSTRNLSFPEAVDYLYDLLVGPGVDLTVAQSQTQNTPKKPLSKKIHEFTEEQKQIVELLRGQFKDEDNKKYIENRHENPISFIDKEPFMEQVNKGVFGEEVKKRMSDIYSNYIVLPWYGINKKLIGLQLRSTDNSSMKYGWSVYTEACLTEPISDREKGTLFITEGLFKARALARIGFRAIALASITTRSGFTDLLDQINDKRKIVIALDNDIFDLGEENGKKGYYKMQNLYEIVARPDEYRTANKSNFDIKVALFPLKYKGIDDYIYACKETNQRDMSMQYPIIGTMDAIRAIDNFRKNGTFLDFDANRDKGNMNTYSNIANVMTDKEIWDRSNKLGLYDRLIFVIADEFYKVIEEFNYLPRKEKTIYAQNYRDINVYLLNLVLSWIVERGVQGFLKKDMKTLVFKKGADINFTFAPPGKLNSSLDKADLEVKDKNHYIEVLTKCGNYEMLKAIKQGRGSKYKNLLDLVKNGSKVEIAYVDLIYKKVVFWRIREDMELEEGATPQAPGREGTSLNFKEEDIIRTIPLSYIF